MPEHGGTVETVVVGLSQVLAQLTVDLREDRVVEFLTQLGYPIMPAQAATIAPATTEVVAKLTDLSTSALEVTAASETGDDNQVLAATAIALADLRLAIASFADLRDAIEALGLPGPSPADIARIPERLLHYSLVESLEPFRVANPILELFGILERVEHPEFTVSVLHLDQLLAWLHDPAQQARTLWGWGDAGFDGSLLFPRLEGVIAGTGLPVIYDETPGAHRLDLILLEVTAPDSLDPRGMRLGLNSTFQSGELELPTGDFTVTGKFGLTAPSGAGITIQPDGNIELIPPDPTTEISGEAELRLVTTDEPYVLLGERGSSRLELGGVGFRAGTRLVWLPSDGVARGQGEFEGSVSDGKILIDTSDGDSFIAQIIPGAKVDGNFELAVGYSTEAGLFFRGSSTTEIRLPMHVELGPIGFDALTVSVGLAADSIDIGLGADIRAQLGPLQAVVKNMGVESHITFPEGGGNLGPMQFGIGYKPPTGIGLSINSRGFKGGGLLDYEEDEERYVGFLELEFENIVALKALGLLTTRLPDGSEGFSLLIIITAEFPTPIQIGFGFKLSGVGGLFGLNRTAKVERLRTGVKDNTLSSVLFPQNIVANASRIISDLRQVFPPQADRFIYCPMAKIGWGSPTLLTIDLGLMIEVPNPVRLLILGVVRAQIPSEEERKKREIKEGREIPRILQLQVNFLGEVDLEGERLFFDASLYDSKLLSFTLAGDMALRFSWGSDPNFLLTVGGFHPAYDPPPLALPNLQRLTLPLLRGNNPRLTLEGYFAITSNTVQFGAKLELYAVKYKFNISGFMSYDVLFQFSPFLFIADIGAMLALRIGSRTIASINVSLTLSGPTPWHARGTAKLKICWFFTLKVRFNKTFGEERDTRLDDVPVLPLLQAVLSNTGNWEVQIPSGRHALVSLREIAVSVDEVVADPAGVIRISQKVVPLNVTIEKFGNQKPSDGHHFAIEQVRVGPVNETELTEMESLSTAAVQEHFAPAQFFEKSDTEKLSSRSFEYYDSGVKVTESEELATDYAVRRPVEYEVFYPHEQRHRRLRLRPDRIPPDFAGFNAGTSQGAVAGSPLSSAHEAKSALAPSAVRFSQEQFVVVNVRDLLPVTEEAVAPSEAGAYSLMREMIRNNPDREGELQVVPTFEVTRS